MLSFIYDNPGNPTEEHDQHVTTTAASVLPAKDNAANADNDDADAVDSNDFELLLAKSFSLPIILLRLHQPRFFILCILS